MVTKYFKTDTAKALGLFALLLIILFSSVFLKGYVFGGGDTTAAKGMTQALTDYLDQTGEYPLWQPYIFSGMPAFSSMMFTKWVYFPNLVLGLFNQIGVPALWTMLLHYLLAAMGAYVLLRHLKLDFLSAILGGLAYMLTPFFIVMISAGHGSQMMTAAYLPWLLYAVKRIFDDPDLKGMLILAIVAGFQFQRGHVQIAYYGWMAAGWYVVIEVIFRAKHKHWDNLLPALGYLAGGLLLGIGLAAVLYIPSLSYAAYSIRGGNAGGGLDYGYATSWSLPPYETLALFFSDWFGFGGQTYWGGRPFTEHSDYLGLVLLILSASAFLNKNYLQEKVFLISAILLALLVSFGNFWPYLYDLLFKTLPFFNKFRVPSMILILLELLTALLAGIGLFTLLTLDDDQKQRWTRRMLYALVGLGGVLILVLLLKGVVTAAYASVLAASPKAHPNLATMRIDMFYSSLIKSLFLGTFSLGLIWGYFDGRLKGWMLSVGMLALVVIDLGQVDLRFTSHAVPASRIKATEQATPAIQELQALTAKNPGRIFPVHTLFGSNVWALYGLESIGGYSPAKLKVLQDFLNSTQLEKTFLPKYYSQTADGAALKPIEAVDAAQRKRHLDVLRDLNVKYLVSPYPMNDSLFKLIDRPAHIIRGQRAQVLIYKFVDAYPRAWFVPRIQTAAVPEEGSLLLNRMTADPKDLAIVVDPENNLQKGTFSMGTVTVKDQSLQSLTLETENQGEGFLVVSEVYYPGGWQAILDDQETLKVYQTNELIRGLVIPAGQHEIRFVYAPPAVKTGFRLTLLSVVIIIGLIAWLIYRRRFADTGS